MKFVSQFLDTFKLFPHFDGFTFEYSTEIYVVA